MKIAPVIVLISGLLVGCEQHRKPAAIDRLHPCATAEGPTDAYCGTFKVFENRDTRQGRTIDLTIVVLPALVNNPKPDPLFFLAGGPGQGAAQMARPLRDVFRRVQSDRDIVLVDQRGTGKSHRLDCRSDNESLAMLNEPDAVALDRLKKCLAGYDADPALYTTTIAMDDLNEIREYLGYDKINIYGGSYGTRAALVYLRRHEPTVRSVILDGVAPTDMRLPLFFARDAQRALDKLIADCEADATCGNQYPNLAERTRAVLARLEADPPTVRLTHPRTGISDDVTVRAELVVNVIAQSLYMPLTASLIPELIKRAEANDFQSLLALAFMGAGGDGADQMAAGMQLSVICAEDYPRITPDQAAKASAGTVFARHLLENRIKACEFWPRGKVDPSYYEPVKSSVPVLVLSGDLDPITPPSWGDSVTPHLSNSKHIIVPATGHGAIGTGCGMRILRSFIDSASPAALDTSCLATLKRPPFFLTPAGPDPAGSTRTAQ